MSDAPMNEAQMGWHPIKTVPDGEPVLLFDYEWEATLGAIQIGAADGKSGFIVDACPDFNPTHWMPLPDYPAGVE